MFKGQGGADIFVLPLSVYARNNFNLQERVLIVETPICPACGCSLVRLGISQEKAIAYHYNDKQYWFCCDGCLELFKSQAEQILHQT